jgi:hypothetical protein
MSTVRRVPRRRSSAAHATPTITICTDGSPGTMKALAIIAAIGC